MSIRIQIIEKEILIKDKLEHYEYYSCDYTGEKRIFFYIASPKDDRDIIVWMNSDLSKNGLGWDYANVLDSCNNIKKIEEAELTFYV